MDDNSTKRKRQEQRQFVTGGVRSTLGSARGRRLGVDAGASLRRPRRRHQAQQRWRRGTVVGDQTSATPTPHIVLS